MAIKVTTPRLVLRELEMGDLDFVAEVRADPLVMRFWPKTYTREESLGWIESHQQRYRDHGHGYWLVVEKETGEAVGQAGVLQSQVGNEDLTNIGYIFHHRFWGRGFATEAARGCLEYIQTQLQERVPTILIRPENEPSMKVAARIGFCVERTVDYGGFAHHVLRLTLDAGLRRSPGDRG